MFRLALAFLALFASAANFRRAMRPAAPPPSPIALAQNAARERAVLLSQLRVETLVEGRDARAAQEGDTITIDYTATVAGGAEILSTKATGKPFTFVLGRARVIEGLWRGLVGARKGERRRVTIPPGLGYSADGLGTLVPPDATLVYDLTIVDLVPRGEAPVRSLSTPRTPIYLYEQFNPDGAR